MTYIWHEPWKAEGSQIRTASGDVIATTAIGELPADVQHAYASHIVAAANIIAGIHSKVIGAEPLGRAADWMALYQSLPPEAFTYAGGPWAWLANVGNELRRLSANAAAWTRMYQALNPPMTAGSGEDDALAEIQRLQAVERLTALQLSRLPADADASESPTPERTGVEA